MKKILTVFLGILVALNVCVVSFAAQSRTTLNVYNWGEYVDQSVLDEFEKENSDIKLNYTTFDSNESMYSKILSGAASYDIVVPSDYMISKMINEDMLAEINFDNVPNFKYIDESYRNLAYDPENKYSVPYTWGTVVIIYNKKFVDPKDVESESIDLLWNEKYKNKILMFDNPRDAFGLSLKSLGYSMNTDNRDEWKAAADKLKKQKPLVQAYVMDAIFDKMEAEEAWIAPYYAGDALTMQEENENLEFYIPKEGTNFFLDCMCILKTSEHKKEAERFINYMCSPAVATSTAEYIGYASPNSGAVENLDSEITGNELIYPPKEKLDRLGEVFINLPATVQVLQSDLWTGLKIESSEGEGEQSNTLNWIDWFSIICVVLFALGLAVYIVQSIRRKKIWKE